MEPPFSCAHMRQNVSAVLRSTRNYANSIADEARVIQYGELDFAHPRLGYANERVHKRTESVQKNAKDLHWSLCLCVR